MGERTIYVEPRVVDDIADCYFYHTMDVPGFGHVEGLSDLRGIEAQYLGGIPLKGKRVLEIGAASGFLSFYMERQGAEVIVYDLSHDQDWDLVPYSRFGDEGYRQGVSQRREHIRRLNNGFWLAHRANRSQARVVYGSVYEIPKEIGEVHVSIFGSVLLHLRDPFLALQRATSLTRETVVVTDHSWRGVQYFSRALRVLGFHMPVMSFAPNYLTCEPIETWWKLSPEIIKSFLGVLGFEKSKVSYAINPTKLGRLKLFTVVAHRAD